MREIIVKIHEVATDGLPDMGIMVGRVAFVFDGCVVSGWPIPGTDLWEANTDVSHNRPFAGVRHWVEFPAPVWDVAA